MQLDDTKQIAKVANKSNFCIFELPKGSDFSTILPSSIHIRKNDDKNVITKDLIDETISLAANKQSSDFNIVVEQAEIMNDAAANCILKNLEEPGEFIHYIFLVNNINKLLPTIKSRAFCYSIKSNHHIKDAPELDADMLTLAKKYVSATNTSDLLSIAEKISKDKKAPREKACALIDAAIELIYKSYFATGKQHFLSKLDKLLAAQEAIVANGNIKLQLIANML